MRTAAASLSLFVCAASGCSSFHLGPPAAVHLAPGAPPPRTDVAQICVLRASLMAQAVTFPTRDNGVLVGATRGNSHFCYLAEPGRHDIVIEADDDAHATLVAEAGKTYYLEQAVDNVLGWVRCRPIWVNATAARELADASTYAVLTGVPGDEVLPPNPPLAPARPVARAL